MERDNERCIPPVMEELAQRLGVKVKNRRLDIPDKFGNGYCKGFIFNDDIRMVIMNYELHEKVVVENPEANTSVQMILFKFQNVFLKTSTSTIEGKLESIPSVFIATSSMNTDAVIPIHGQTGTINIEVNVNYLKTVLDLPEKSIVLQSLLENTQPLLFEQLIYPSLQEVVDEIASESVDESFKSFFLRVKAEELICRLLMELANRDEKRLYDLNIQDVQTVYKIKDQMLENLNTPPMIRELALCAGMSPTKLKLLFKQIFGNSIFSYYQEFRMKEAAILLRAEKRSVSDVGYQLGFTNLSHFSRVFKAHIGVNPKQYSR